MRSLSATRAPRSSNQRQQPARFRSAAQVSAVQCNGFRASKLAWASSKASQTAVEPPRAEATRQGLIGIGH